MGTSQSTASGTNHPWLGAKSWKLWIFFFLRFSSKLPIFMIYKRYYSGQAWWAFMLVCVHRVHRALLFVIRVCSYSSKAPTHIIFNFLYIKKLLRRCCFLMLLIFVRNRSYIVMCFTFSIAHWWWRGNQRFISYSGYTRFILWYWNQWITCFLRSKITYLSFAESTRMERSLNAPSPSIDFLIPFKF